MRTGYLAKALVFVICWCVACAVSASDTKIGILVFDGVLTSDVTAPAEVFGAASRQAWFKDYSVDFIGINQQSTIKTEEGLVLAVNYSIADALELDTLIVPSRYDMDPLLENKELTDFLKEQGAKVNWLGSNCSGSFLLARAGLLDGLRATTWAGGENDLRKQFPSVKVVEDENVVVDGRVISSNGSVVSYQAALVMLAKMSSESRAKEVFEALQLNRIMEWEEVANYL